MCLLDLLGIRKVVLYMQYVTISLPVLPFPVLHAAYGKDSGETNHTVTSQAGRLIMVQSVWCSLS
jgi:hypothetical protein